MNFSKLLLAPALVSILFLVACSDLQDNLPAPLSGGIKIHEEGWNADPSNASFHGRYIKSKEWDLAECKPCHGSSYDGGVSGKSCFTCHSIYPHAERWEGDTSDVSFHGKYLKSKDWDPTECRACHGTSYDGGMSEVTCFSCHASFPHETKFSGGDDHELYMANNGYPLNECKTCHGSDLTGGARVKVSCSSPECHADAGGTSKSPEACNTCHGRFRAAADDTLSWAPPSSLSGDTLTTSSGVGAHQAHLLGARLSANAQCNQCHAVPSGLFNEGHIDSPLPAEHIFSSSLAALTTADGTFQPNPSYDTLRCSGVYCHGNWKLRRASSPNNFVFTDSVMTGESYSPTWTNGQSEAECGTCHTLPPRGHQNLPSCSGCHIGIVDASRTIIDKSKHINGKVNVFGTERSF